MKTLTLDDPEGSPGTAATQPAASEPPGDPEPAEIDRYRIVGKLGAGGMGVVYEAHDPQLDRRIALKLVRATTTQPLAQANLVREAQAMAKLQHPNVVAVYDVGLYQGRVFVAMELVAGTTLRDWLAAETRPWRTIVAAFVGASRGLAAAHAAGLVHRDFKPDNVLVSSDGTARLTDFGLARPVDDTERIEAGTLAYMAPEQHDGAPVTEAADQFAFATALWEAVFGVRPFAGDTAGALAEAKRTRTLADVPRGRAVAGWLVAALRRALAPDPADRFPSLTALGRALERGLARRRRAIVATAAVVVAAGTFVGGLQASSGPAACGGAASDLAATWNAGARERVIAHLRTLGPYATQEAGRLADELARYGEHWVEARAGACKAADRGELTPLLYERNIACLERARSALGAAVDVLSRAPEQRISDSITAARSLPDPGACRARTLGVATVTPPPPVMAPLANSIANNLESVRVRAQAGEPGQSEAAAVLVAEAERLGYKPLVARGRLVQGFTWFARNDTAASLPFLDAAAKLALAAGDDVTFIEAFARQVFAISYTESAKLAPGSRDAIGAVPYAETIAVRLGEAAAFERPLLYNNIGVYYFNAQDPRRARSYFELATAEPRTRAGNAELAAAFGNLAYVVDSPAERDRYLTAERTTIERLLGADHLRSLAAALKAAFFITDPTAAAAAFRAPCDRLIELHPREAVDHIDECLYEQWWLADERGDRVAARALVTRISKGSDYDVVKTAYLHLLDGALDAVDVTKAAEWLRQPEPWIRRMGAEAALIGARADVARGRRAEAIARLAAARAAVAGLPATPHYQRRIARLDAELAALRGSR